MMTTMKMVMDLCPLDNDTVKIGRGVDGKLARCVHTKVKPSKSLSRWSRRRRMLLEMVMLTSEQTFVIMMRTSLEKAMIITIMIIGRNQCWGWWTWWQSGWLDLKVQNGAEAWQCWPPCPPPPSGCSSSPPSSCCQRSPPLPPSRCPWMGCPGRGRGMSYGKKIYRSWSPQQSPMSWSPVN